jgi:hypothetical protein
MAFLTEAANRGSIATGYEIDNSVKLEQPERLNRGYDGAGNIASITATDRKKTTLSYWVKRTQLNASGNGIVFIMYAGNAIMLGFENDKLRVSTNYGYSLISNALFRDTSAWYHLVFSIDTTQGTANDRVKVYVNGAEYTDWGTQSITISQNANNGMFNEVNGGHYFGWSDSQATGCYVAEAHCIDGQALTASDFGKYDINGIWVPIEYTGTYGNQGYYLDFKNASNLGEDQSGNGNDFGTFYGGGSENQATDTPTNNFCTLNPLGENTGSAVINEGATKIDNSGTASWETAYSSIGVTSGKWYAEVTPQLGSFNTSFGIVNFDTAIHDGTTYNSAGYWLGNFDSGASIYYYFNGSGAGSIVVNVSAGVVIGLALDLDNNTLDFYVNGSQNKQATSLPSGTYGFFADVQGTGGPYIQCNFGGYTVNTISSAETDENGYGTFEYAPPSGYYALCTKNLAEYG